MTQQESLNIISSSFDSLKVVNTMLANSMSTLLSGSENVMSPNYVSGWDTEEKVLYALEKNYLILESCLNKDWYTNSASTSSVSPSKILELQTAISSSKEFIETHSSGSN